jgi:hypothetical protein
MMGYDVDFGHKQAADLIPSNNYDEKQVGYQALTILLNEVRRGNGNPRNRSTPKAFRNCFAFSSCAIHGSSSRVCTFHCTTRAHTIWMSWQ